MWWLVPTQTADKNVRRVLGAVGSSALTHGNSASVCEQALSLRSLWGNYTTKKHVWDFWAPASKSLFFLAATPAPRVHTLLLRASDSRNFPPLVRIAQCADFAARLHNDCRAPLGGKGAVYTYEVGGSGGGRGRN